MVEEGGGGEVDVGAPVRWLVDLTRRAGSKLLEGWGSDVEG